MIFIVGIINWNFMFHKLILRFFWRTMKQATTLFNRLHAIAT